MSSIIRGNFRMAMASIRGTKWRSGFTMLGVVVAVVPVLLILGIGEGVRRQTVEQVASLGSNLLIVRPGIMTDDNAVSQFTAMNGYSTSGTFTKKDFEAIQKISIVSMVAPISITPGAITVNDEPITDTFVVGTTPAFPILMNHKVRHGDFFSEKENFRRVAIVGRDAAEKIFGEDIPLGRAFDYRGETFIVRGVLEEADVAPLSFSANFNKAVLIPYDVASDLSGTSASNEFLIKPKDGVSLKDASKQVSAALETSRGGAKDFSILTQSENLRVTNKILNLITGLVTAVAAIALLVSGIGIMNIMLVTVTERMHEIGVRKAIGASKRQIMGQFMAEATLLSVVGGLIGIIVALVCQYFIRLFTSLEPVITWQMMVLVFGVSLIVGVIFGGVPALKAAKKDPIAALRHE